jgi:hypothetical protein
MVQLSAIRCKSSDFCCRNPLVASQRVFVVVSVYFVIDSVRELLDTPSYSKTHEVYHYVIFCIPRPSSLSPMPWCCGWQSLFFVLLFTYPSPLQRWQDAKRDWSVRKRTETSGNPLDGNRKASLSNASQMVDRETCLKLVMESLSSYRHDGAATP